MDYAAKISAIDIQLENREELSVQTLASLRKYKAYLERQLQPKPAYAKFKIPAAVVGGVSLLLVVGSLFSGPKTAEVVQTETTSEISGQVAPVQSTAEVQATLSFELGANYAQQSAFGEYLRYAFERAKTPNEITALNHVQGALPHIGEEYYQRTAQEMQRALEAGQTPQQAATAGAAKFKSELSHFPPQASIVVSRGILIHHGLAKPADFGW